MSSATSSVVMPGQFSQMRFRPGIHDFIQGIQVVDGRAKPGHDGFAFANRPKGGHDALACVAHTEATP